MKGAENALPHLRINLLCWVVGLLVVLTLCPNIIDVVFLVFTIVTLVAG